MIYKKTAKELLSESAFELLSTKSLDQITVQNIIDNCGLSRKTFYNYFLDKYNLFEWTYTQTLLQNFMKINRDYHFREALLAALYILKNQSTLLGKLKNEELLHRYYIRLRETLTNLFNEHHIIIDPELAFLIDYTCFAEIHTVSRWLNNEIKKTPEELCHLLTAALPERIKSILQENGLF